MKIGATLKRLLGQRAPGPAEREARRAFEAQHPGERVSWTWVAAAEPDRTVVGVVYGNVIPGHLVFYQVSKETGRATRVEDPEPYRPRPWR